MKTNYVIASLPVRYSRDPGDLAILAAGQATKSAQSVEARRRARERVVAQFEEARAAGKFTPDTQPRDPAGKFRRVLARLKLNLGDQASEQLAKKIEDAEAAGSVGNYAAAKTAGAEVIKLIDNVQDGELAKGTIKNLRAGARSLGKLLAYMPLPQGDPNAKVRFSDLPSPTATLIQTLLKKVDAKLSNEDAAKYTTILKNFLAGGRTMSSDEMSAELSKLLRVLA